MELAPHIVPGLADITRQTMSVESNLKVKDVVDIFQRDPSLLALPVVHDGRFSGVVNRKELFSRHLGSPFALDLFGKKAISVLLEGEPPSVAAELDINAALERLLALDPKLEIDAVPIVSDDHCVGIMSVADLMMKISSNQAMLLHTLHLLSDRIREEVATASRIQHDLLPPSEFGFNGVTISAGVTTSTEIGGDFYDYFVLDDHRLGLVIADVSGHGVQSGMVTTAAKASLHTLISQGARTPAELLFGMNNAILATARRTLLMTCLVAVLDLTRGTLTLANAGHNFPYLYRQGTRELSLLDACSGYPLGFEGEGIYTEFTTGFEPGDTLFLYTDGLVECTDGADREFGYERLEELLMENAHLEPSTLRERILASARQFNGAAPFADDVTLLAASFRNADDHDARGKGVL